MEGQHGAMEVLREPKGREGLKVGHMGGRWKAAARQVDEGQPGA